MSQPGTNGFASSIEEYRARARSDCNVRLNSIVATLKDLEDEIVDWFDEGHGADCDCPFCSSPFCKSDSTTDGDLIDADLMGLLYNTRTAQSILSGQTHLLPEDLAEPADADPDEPVFAQR